MRKLEAAYAAQVTPGMLDPVSVDTVQRTLQGQIDSIILQVATQEPATYWHIRGTQRFILDDPFFGDPVEFGNLAYDSTLGLYSRKNQ